MTAARIVESPFHRQPCERDQVIDELRRRLRAAADIHRATTFQSASSAALSPATTAVWVRDPA